MKSTDIGKKRAEERRANKNKVGFKSTQKQSASVITSDNNKELKRAEKEISLLKMKIEEMEQSTNRKPEHLKTAPRTFTIQNGAFESFRNACRKQGLSMSQVLSGFMKDFSGNSK